MNSNTAKIIQFETLKIKGIRGGYKKPPIEPLGFAKGLTNETMKNLLNRFSNPTTEENYRNHALLLFMSITGLRAKEIVGSKFSDLLEGPFGETLLKYRKKGGKIGFAVLPKDLSEIIKNYHSKFLIKSDFFFQSLPKRHQTKRSPLSKRGLQFIVSSWNVKTCQGRNIHCHALRHTVGIRLLQKAGSIAAQQVLGHSSPITTSKFYTLPYFDGSEFLKTWD
ncbi:tyrosine-type recombinase/integrase [Leptospira interrogans]|uniref:tyrosine-type recombinase/integrase n=1 Tax=Leptospira interrogans TaxID=173 RepID=UPI0002B994D4|nr:tyrosine-type recombinase/integrase [Leptospira interrogans]MCR8649123.1 recombinase XerC [Leptospira interrogans serovar Bataviae]OAM86106.1 recombinase XerC [Leptospira interrogans serovar Bataviae]QOI40464.1 tyrosine-type recombinase/integrase [Leptospira interrogans serovar Bataviae]